MRGWRYVVSTAGEVEMTLTEMERSVLLRVGCWCLSSILHCLGETFAVEILKPVRLSVPLPMLNPTTPAPGHWKLDFAEELTSRALATAAARSAGSRSAPRALGDPEDHGRECLAWKTRLGISQVKPRPAREAATASHSHLQGAGPACRRASAARGCPPGQ
mmetsp:Transcript_148811/g.273247  ORF Transcript_148811/g.273247 Transcript_148811/m.273247 type:complete len:161 (+) Transcript_148811:275-757(+)